MVTDFGHHKVEWKQFKFYSWIWLMKSWAVVVTNRHRTKFSSTVWKNVPIFNFVTEESSPEVSKLCNRSTSKWVKPAWRRNIWSIMVFDEDMWVSTTCVWKSEKMQILLEFPFSVRKLGMYWKFLKIFKRFWEAVFSHDECKKPALVAKNVTHYTTILRVIRIWTKRPQKYNTLLWRYTAWCPVNTWLQS